ncbi:MAG: response regulator [Myxococcaceae bacterium]
MPEGSPGDRNRRARTVLIVDDDLDVLEGLAKIVSEHEHSPLVAMNGRDALEVLSRVDGPCLILLDLFMPVMDGFQLLRALERYQDPEDYPVVVMTASNAATPIHASVVARLNRPCPLQGLLWVLDPLAPWNRVSRRIDADGWNEGDPHVPEPPIRTVSPRKNNPGFQSGVRSGLPRDAECGTGPRFPAESGLWQARRPGR